MTAAYIQEEQRTLGYPAICGLGKSPGNGGCKQKLHNGFSMQVVIAKNAGLLTLVNCISQLCLHDTKLLAMIWGVHNSLARVNCGHIFWSHSPIQTQFGNCDHQQTQSQNVDTKRHIYTLRHIHHIEFLWRKLSSKMSTKCLVGTLLYTKYCCYKSVHFFHGLATFLVTFANYGQISFLISTYCTPNAHCLYVNHQSLPMGSASLAVHVHI